MSGESAARQPERPVDIHDRAFSFAVRIIRLCKHLDEKPGTARTLARQVLRSGTSIGANLEEAQGAHSKRDFICKNEIALKEARETKYWLRLLSASETLAAARMKELEQECDEITRIVGSIVVSAKQNLKN